MQLFNTMTRSEEPFAPGPDNTVRMYTCGLTVYARGHIGNFRSFICADVLRRTLRHLLGYNVRQVMNFTDVDDRTISGARQAGMDLRTYTTQYVDMFLVDANVVLYAHDADTAHHDRARRWLEDAISNQRPV